MIYFTSDLHFYHDKIIYAYTKHFIMQEENKTLI